MTAVQNINLAVRFLLEVIALVAVAYWGGRAGTGGWRWLLALGAPALLAMLWATFGSPKAPVQLDPAPRLLFEALVFGSAATALAAAGRPLLAVSFAALVVLNRALMILWRQ